MSNENRKHTGEARVAVRGERFGGRGPGPSQSTISPFWYALAAYFGSILLKSIHNATGLAGFTGSERLALGVTVMALFISLVAISGTLAATLRERT